MVRLGELHQSVCDCVCLFEFDDLVLIEEDEQFAAQLFLPRCALPEADVAHGVADQAFDHVEGEVGEPLRVCALDRRLLAPLFFEYVEKWRMNERVQPGHADVLLSALGDFFDEVFERERQLFPVVAELVKDL